MSVLGKRSKQSLDDSEEHDPQRKKQKLSDEDDDILPLGNDDQIPKSVILNVGGIKYETTIQTLTGYQSMLKARFSSKYAMNPSNDGSYFIDADGELFKYILKYLRTGMLLLPTSWNKHQIWEFYAEIKYFMVQSLFDKVLLKLFDSQIIRNSTLKLKIIQKISETLKWNDNKSVNIMESLNEWELMKFGGRYGIAHSLSLVAIHFTIYGLFLTTYWNSSLEKRCYDFRKSFAFHCCENSYHLLSTKKDVDVQFSKVRKLTQEEQKNPVTEDDQTKITYQWNEPLHPFAIRTETKTIKDKYRTQKTNNKQVKYAQTSINKFTYFSNSELWSIPM